MNNLSSNDIQNQIAAVENLAKQLKWESVQDSQKLLAVAESLRDLLALREAGKEPAALVDIQSGRPDGNKFALVFNTAMHKLPDDVYHLYAAPQLPAVDSIQRYTAANTQFGGVSLRPDGDGDYVRFEDVRAMIAAAPKPETL